MDVQVHLLERRAAVTDVEKLKPKTVEASPMNESVFDISGGESEALQRLKKVCGRM